MSTFVVLALVWSWGRGLGLSPLASLASRVLDQAVLEGRCVVDKRRAHGASGVCSMTRLNLCVLGKYEIMERAVGGHQ